MSRHPSTVATPGTASPIDWDNEPASMVAERAARRAIEAMSVAGTLRTDVEALTARIDALEALCADLIEIIAAMAER
jgi:hypothetical protein